jgi:hypothetical protein
VNISSRRKKPHMLARRFPPPWTTEVCCNTFAAASAAKAITSACRSVTAKNYREFVMPLIPDKAAFQDSLASLPVGVTPSGKRLTGAHSSSANALWVVCVVMSLREPALGWG